MTPTELDAVWVPQAMQSQQGTTYDTRLGSFKATVTGHPGRDGWRWWVQTLGSTADAFAHAEGGRGSGGTLNEAQAKEIALHVMAIAIFVSESVR